MANQPRETAGDRGGNGPSEARGAGAGIDLNRVKRAATAVLGGALLVRGLERRSLRGAVTVLVGGWLLSRAIGGNPRSDRPIRSLPVIGSREEEQTGDAGPTTVSRSATIGRPADALYEAWRDPDQFSRVMGHFADVTSPDGDRRYWTVHGPAGQDLSWETHVVEEEPGEYIRWESPEDAVLPNEGTIRFRPAPGDRGTQVTLSISFYPPGGALGTAALHRLDVVPKGLAGEALRRFKSLAESGEIQTLEGNPSGRGKGGLL